jgi:ABC-2 type transport system ATP-binding protein
VENLIEVTDLTKHYGATMALDGVSFNVRPGRIVGLIGANGAGKTTVLNAVLGLVPCSGGLRVLGLDPRRQRSALVERVSFIADVAVLPRWLRVAQAIDFVEGVHPRFRRARCEEFLARGLIPRERRIGDLSKGMIAQLHLAIAMAVDAELLVLDEPTLGLDIIARKQFYDGLLAEYMDAQRTVLVTTHQVEEIEHVLTDVVLIDRGRVILNLAMDDIAQRFAELIATPAGADAARLLRPIAERQVMGRPVFLFDGVERSALSSLGEVRVPSIADLFVALVRGEVA